MKRITLVLAIATLLATSCSKDETLRIRQDEESIIGFTSISDRLVKSEEIRINNLGTFNVYGYHYTTATPDYTSAVKYFDDVAVTASADGSSCTYSPLKYWPASGKIDFFAYKYMTMDPAAATEIPVSYTVESTVDLQKDVVVAKALEKVKGAAVALPFHHALSQIRFYARSEVNGIKFDITKIEILNVKPSGTSKLVDWTIPSTVTTTGNGLQWIADGTAVTYEAGLANNTNIGYATGDGHANYTNITATTGALMLIPQTLSAGSTSGRGISPETGKSYIKITYGAKDNDGNQIVAGGTTYFIKLGDSWCPGVRYNYCIGFKDPTEFGADVITFSATVEDWVDDDRQVII